LTSRMGQPARTTAPLSPSYVVRVPISEHEFSCQRGAEGAAVEMGSFFGGALQGGCARARERSSASAWPDAD
jgi:hypothetical protein